MPQRSIFSAFTTLDTTSYRPFNGTPPNSTEPLYVNAVEFDTNGEIDLQQHAFIAKRDMFMRFHFNMLFLDVGDGVAMAAHLYVHRVSDGSPDYVECAGEDSVSVTSFGHALPQGPSCTKILKLKMGDKVQCRPFFAAACDYAVPRSVVNGEVTCNYFQGDEISLEF